MLEWVDDGLVSETIEEGMSSSAKRVLRTAEEKRREFEKVWAKVKKIQERVRRRGLSDNMLSDDDLYDERGLPK